MIKIIKHTDGSVSFKCPGCKNKHRINTPDNMQWQWNGDLEKPTITPSILWRSGDLPNRPGSVMCHSFVTDGKIRFLDDCPHELRGKEVELPDIDNTIVER